MTPFCLVWHINYIHGLKWCTFHVLQLAIYQQWVIIEIWVSNKCSSYVRIKAIISIPIKYFSCFFFRNQLTNVTVKKITHRETGVTYAAKFSSRFRYALPGAEPVDCSVEVLHEIAMLSVCTQSDKIVHLKDVFENQNEIILVLE